MLQFHYDIKKLNKNNEEMFIEYIDRNFNCNVPYIEINKIKCYTSHYIKNMQNNFVFMFFILLHR